MSGLRKGRRLRLAPLDSQGQEIQRVLDLISPVYATKHDPKDGAKYEGYCGAASEAYLHLAGGRDSGLKVMRRTNPDGSSHWWLLGPRGVIDLTLGPADRRYQQAHPRKTYPYEEGQPAMFRTGYDKSSKRAAAIIELVTSRR